MRLAGIVERAPQFSGGMSSVGWEQGRSIEERWPEEGEDPCCVLGGRGSVQIQKRMRHIYKSEQTHHSDDKAVESPTGALGRHG